MLQYEPSKRITAAQALKHPFFDSLREKGYIKNDSNDNTK